MSENPRVQCATVFAAMAARIVDFNAAYRGPGMLAYESLDRKSRAWFGEPFHAFVAGKPDAQSVQFAMGPTGPFGDINEMALALGQSPQLIRTLLERLADEILQLGYSNPVSDAAFQRIAEQYECDEVRIRNEVASDNKRRFVEQAMERGGKVARKALEPYPDLLDEAIRRGLVM